MLASASLLCLLVGLLYLALQIRTIFSDQLKQEYAGLVLEAAERAESARAMVGVWQLHSGDSQAQTQGYLHARIELADRLNSLAALVNASPSAAPRVPASALTPDASLTGTDALLATIPPYWRAQRDADGADVRLRIAHVANVLIALAALLFGMLLTALGMYAKRNRQLAGESHEFEYAALHDPMTGLPNRRKLFATLDEAAANLQAGPTDRNIAVLYVDLDGFKQVNDRHGHTAGDEVLEAVATRLTETLRHGEFAARLGGDEFAVIVENAALHAVVAIAERVIREIAKPYPLTAGGTIHIGTSIGIALAEAQEPVDDLIRRADEAMYSAKKAGKGTYRISHGQTEPEPDADADRDASVGTA